MVPKDNAIWLGATVTWAALAVLSWLLSWFSPGIQFSSSYATVLALMIAALGIGLRLPLADRKATVSPDNAQLVWLLCLAASINWLGYLQLRSGSAGAVLPALVILVTAELWLVYRALPAQLPWTAAWMLQLRERWEYWNGTLPLEDHSAQGKEAFDQVEFNVISDDSDVIDLEESSWPQVEPTSGQDVPSMDPFQDPLLTRTSCDGADENGLRYASGDGQVSHAGWSESDGVCNSLLPCV